MPSSTPRFEVASLFLLLYGVVFAAIGAWILHAGWLGAFGPAIGWLMVFWGLAFAAWQAVLVLRRQVAGQR